MVKWVKTAPQGVTSKCCPTIWGEKKGGLMHANRSRWGVIRSVEFQSPGGKPSGEKSTQMLTNDAKFKPSQRWKTQWRKVNGGKHSCTMQHTWPPGCHNLYLKLSGKEFRQKSSPILDISISKSLQLIKLVGDVHCSALARVCNNCRLEAATNRNFQMHVHHKHRFISLHVY